jgi:anti-sigma B factor antagonist
MGANPVIRALELKLETERKDSETTVRTTGRITSGTSATLEKTLRELMPEGKRIVLDLANVDHIDSAGIGALVSVFLHASRTNCHLKITNPKERIRDLFQRSGLAAVFEGDSFDELWKVWSRNSSEG